MAKFRVVVVKDDYMKVNTVVEKYAKGCVSVTGHYDVNELEFTCKNFKSKRCEEDLELLNKIGIMVTWKKLES